MKKFLYKYIISRYYHVLYGTNISERELNLNDKKCLCLAPHPDDESIGMAGTLAKYPENFDVVCLTDGSRAGSNLTKEELIKTREKEFNVAMGIAKIKNYRMLGLPDKQLAVNAMEKQIDISEYDYIFIANIMEQHRDHKANSLYLDKLLRNGKYKKDVKILFYEVWSALALPNCYVDITNQKNTKQEMINSYKSQIEEYDYTNRVLALNSYRGLSKHVDYAECFMEMDVKLFKKLLKICSLI